MLLFQIEFVTECYYIILRKVIDNEQKHTKTVTRNDGSSWKWKDNLH